MPGNHCSFQAPCSICQHGSFGGASGTPRGPAVGRNLWHSHGPHQGASGGADTAAGDPELGDSAHNQVISAMERVGARGVPLCWGPVHRGHPPRAPNLLCPARQRTWVTPGVTCQPWTQHGSSTAPALLNPTAHTEGTSGDSGEGPPAAAGTSLGPGWRESRGQGTWSPPGRAGCGDMEHGERAGDGDRAHGAPGGGQGMRTG